MEHRNLKLLLGMIVTASMLIACSNSTPNSQQTPTPDPTSVAEQTITVENYKDTMNGLYQYIASKSTDFEYETGEIGIWEIINYSDEQPLQKIGYTLMDLTGDGRSELLIGEIPEDYESMSMYQKDILAAYTLVDNTPKLLFEGWDRNAHFLLQNGAILNEGSSGAIYSNLTIYQYTNDGWICIDNYFTAEDEDNPEEIAYYHNTTGSLDIANAERWNLSEDDYWANYTKAESQVVTVQWTPFVEYAYTGPIIPVASPVTLAFQEDTALSEEDHYETWIADEGEYSQQVVISTRNDTVVEKFRFLSLQLEEGKDQLVGFRTKELYSMESLASDCPLVVTMSFPGDMPNYGFSYLDESGQEQYFAISISGKDGSLIYDDFIPIK